LQEQGQDLQLWRIYRKAGIRKEYHFELEHVVIKLIDGIDT